MITDAVIIKGKEAEIVRLKVEKAEVEHALGFAIDRVERLEAEKAEMLNVLEKLSSLLVDGEEYVPLELREEMITAIRKARGEE